MGEIVLDALVDALWLMPVVFILHLLLELCEDKLFGRAAVGKALLSPAAPLAGALTGVVPQCGFPVVAANLYATDKITLGTLLAVLIATTDEALPVLLGSPASALKALPLVGLQLALAVVVGYAAQLFFRGKRASAAAEISAPVVGENGAVEPVNAITGDENAAMKTESGAIAELAKDENICSCRESENADRADETHDGKSHEKESHEGEAHGGSEHGEEEHIHVCHGHTSEEGEFKIKDMVLHVLYHTGVVILFVFVVNLAFGALIGYLGEERLIKFLAGTKYARPFVAALIGLIPNCAASVIIARLYALGGLSLGAALAGAGAAAGISYAVLVKENRLRGLAIIGAMYAICSLAGLMTDLVAAAIGA